ncbi:hypothetical protein DL96DRAFT_1460536, partial [Flagelloscypha sp. PMI_526]
IAKGLRGESLRPALHVDFQTWVFERPDKWPQRPQNDKPLIFQNFVPSSSATIKILALPVEVLLEVFSFLGLIDILDISSTCKSLRKYITNSETLFSLVRELINHGSLCWVKPFPLVKEEVERPRRRLWSWIQSDENNLQLAMDHFGNAEFPSSLFIHYCLVNCSSMKSRRRLFGNVKQIKGWWDVHWANEKTKRTRAG